MGRPKSSKFSGVMAGAKKTEFDQRVLDLRRVTRVVAGGKRFKFRATVVVGNRQGKVGVGVAKGADVSQAVEKAVHDAKKNLIIVPLIKNTIPHEVSAKYSAAKVLLKPALEGRGVIAGGAVRVICNLVGIKSISAKILGRTSNKLNNARATIEAFKKLKSKTGKSPAAKTEIKNDAAQSTQTNP
ncbi:MAG: 30S ribosomal protein S5 [bacterium]|nr:30S ribosomal protein S5 [bacterium]